MLVGVLAGVSIFFFVLLIYPYIIYPVFLRFFPVRPVEHRAVRKRVSLLFCAYNEGASLPAKLHNLRLLKARHPDLEILAFDDGSSDETARLLAAASDILTFVPGSGRSGKASGMKHLASLAAGEILIFTDANVILAEDAVDRLLPYYSDNKVGGVCGTLCYADEEGSATAEVGSLYWRLDEKLRTLESQTGNVMGADGSLFSIRNALYPAFPDSVLDDFTVSMSVIFAGYRLIKAPDVLAFENSVAERSDELRRKIRIGARSYHTHLHLRSQLRTMRPIDRFKYGSRKLLRWFGGANLVLAVVFALAAIAAYSLVWAAVGTAAAAAILFALTRTSHRLFAKLGDVLLAIFATQLGIFKGMRGETVTTWSPAKSR
ncbi:glycosyltransferase [Allopontixanthobacter sp.]|uniref:glycosyltransferase n=1 Tax=Allopontixanthobacter sp. TaxID=2906452 RepID=UPI002ABA72D2|nr:glycosyltransferase [Allopontixanthobacter sp.]MDZ4307951.1 glycosyltransferase [Allopontixanthobacter sp.]